MNRESKQRKDSRESLKNRMAEVASMPKDVILGVPIITMTGRIETRIENYNGIIEYTDILIRVSTKSGQIRIVGEDLQIEYYTSDEMKVTGHIQKVEYC